MKIFIYFMKIFYFILKYIILLYYSNYNIFKKFDKLNLKIKKNLIYKINVARNPNKWFCR